MTTLEKTASWVICNRSTGYPVFETFHENTALTMADSDKYRAVPILEYLQSFNYEQRVANYEAEGMTRSDAQAVVDAELIQE